MSSDASCSRSNRHAAVHFLAYTTLIPSNPRSAAPSSNEEKEEKGLEKLGRSRSQFVRGKGGARGKLRVEIRSFEIPLQFSPSLRKHLHNPIDEDAFIPSQPRSLTLRLPSLVRRRLSPSSSHSLGQPLRGCLRHPRVTPDEREKEVETPDLRTASPPTFHSPPLNTTTTLLRPCCTKCFLATQAPADPLYIEHWTIGARRKWSADRGTEGGRGGGVGGLVRAAAETREEKEKVKECRRLVAQGAQLPACCGDWHKIGDKDEDENEEGRGYPPSLAAAPVLAVPPPHSPKSTPSLAAHASALLCEADPCSSPPTRGRKCLSASHSRSASASGRLEMSASMGVTLFPSSSLETDKTTEDAERPFTQNEPGEEGEVSG